MVPHTGGASEITKAPDNLRIVFGYVDLAEEVLARSTIKPDSYRAIEGEEAPHSSIT
jgi:hypothetical protein